MWPVVPHRITLRVCQDMDWRVTVSCSKCRVSTMIWPGKTPVALQAVPLGDLLKRQAFKCYKVQYGCNGIPAGSLTVDCMDVGMLKEVAAFKV